MHGSVGARRYAGGWQARFGLEEGHLEVAARWAHESGLSVDDEPHFRLVIGHKLLARVCIAQGQTGDALRLLQRLQQHAEQQGRTPDVIETLALQAVALYRQNDAETALATLSRALRLAELEGYFRTFVDEGQPMAELLRLAARSGMQSQYVARLLAAFGKTTETIPPKAQGLAEPLSERELEVLQLLAEGLSNQAMAERLFISLSTVKAHLNSIYSKLDVHTRTQALTRARELGLLMSPS